MNDAEQLKAYKAWSKKKDKRGTHTRWDILNHLIKVFQYKTYLEIGVRNGECISKVNAPLKHGVDPTPNKHVDFVMTSDEFFQNLDKNVKYDLIFIDGMHHWDQVYRDVVNSLAHLLWEGTIVCHDMNPPFEICQRREKVVSTWNGDSWKAFVSLRGQRSDLYMFTVDTDFGLGMIRKGMQKPISLPENIDFDYFSQHKKELLNLISVDEFLSKFTTYE